MLDAKALHLASQGDLRYSREMIPFACVNLKGIYNQRVGDSSLVAVSRIEFSCTVLYQPKSVSLYYD